jgi:hypothetical protein
MVAIVDMVATRIFIWLLIRLSGITAAFITVIGKWGELQEKIVGAYSSMPA